MPSESFSRPPINQLTATERAELMAALGKPAEIERATEVAEPDQFAEAVGRALDVLEPTGIDAQVIDFLTHHSPADLLITAEHQAISGEVLEEEKYRSFLDTVPVDLLPEGVDYESFEGLMFRQEVVVRLAEHNAPDEDPLHDWRAAVRDATNSLFNRSVPVRQAAQATRDNELTMTFWLSGLGGDHFEGLDKPGY